MAKKRRFRFGVQVSQAVSRAEWVEKAKKAEALGFDVLVMPDHLGGDFAVGPALAIASGAATTLRLGTLVLQSGLRHPALVALEAATLDILTDGRFELGLGAGGSYLPDYEGTGIPFEPPGIRVGRLEESLRIIKGLFGNGAVTFSGHHYSITNLEGLPKPVQRPYPPILVGGGGPRVLSIAAREADIVSIFPSMVRTGGRFRDEETRTAAVAAKVDLIRDAAGDRFAGLELNILVQVVVPTDSRQAGIEQLTASWGVSAEDAVDSPYIYVGTPAQMADDLRSYQERLGTTYFTVFERHMDAFAPVVAALAGQ